MSTPAVTANGTTYFPLTQAQYNACLHIVVTAQQTWANLVAQFAAENIAMGISQAGKTGLIGNALSEVLMYGSTGSLWQAYAALDNVKITPEMSPYLTADRIQWMKNTMIAAIGNLPTS
jgi:hypothetical protein